MKKKEKKKKTLIKSHLITYIIIIVITSLLSLQIQPLLTVLSYWGHFGREKSMFLSYKFLTYDVNLLTIWSGALKG